MKSGDRNGETPRRAHNPGHDYLELWIGLSRLRWSSLVLVPTERDGSTTEIANALAEIGRRLSFGPVTAITVDSLEYGSALALADLQQHLDRERRTVGGAAPAVNVPSAGAAAPAAAGAPAPAPAPPSGGTPAAAASPAAAPAEPAAPGPAPEATPDPGVEKERDELAVIPPARLIISVPPVITEPLSITAAEQADAVVLAVRLNRSRIADVQRTLDLIGRQRVKGCFLVR